MHADRDDGHVDVGRDEERGHRQRLGAGAFLQFREPLVVDLDSERVGRRVPTCHRRVALDRLVESRQRRVRSGVSEAEPGRDRGPIPVLRRREVDELRRQTRDLPGSEMLAGHPRKSVVAGVRLRALGTDERVGRHGIQDVRGRRARERRPAVDSGGVPL